MPHHDITKNGRVPHYESGRFGKPSALPERSDAKLHAASLGRMSVDEPPTRNINDHRSPSRLPRREESTRNPSRVPPAPRSSRSPTFNQHEAVNQNKTSDRLPAGDQRKSDLDKLTESLPDTASGLDNAGVRSSNLSQTPKSQGTRDLSVIEVIPVLALPSNGGKYRSSGQRTSALHGRNTSSSISPSRIGRLAEPRQADLSVGRTRPQHDSMKDGPGLKGDNLPEKGASDFERLSPILGPSGTEVLETKRASKTGSTAVGTKVVAATATSLSRPRRTISSTKAQSKDSRVTSVSSKPRREPDASSTSSSVSSRGTDAQQKRPNFTTLQRHYTPKKAPKSLSTTSSRPITTAVVDSTANSSATARQQTELLQLFILDSLASHAYQAWQGSAKQTIYDRFVEARRAMHDVAQADLVHQRAINIEALRAWHLSVPNGNGIAEKALSLGEVVQDVLSFTESQGRFNKVCRRFETWLHDVESIRLARVHKVRQDSGLSSPGQSSEDLGFIESLGVEWKSDTNSLVRRMEKCMRQISNVGQPLEGSTLSIMAQNCLMLGTSIMEALEVMQDIERMLLLEERKWVGEMISGVTPTTPLVHFNDTNQEPDHGGHTSTIAIRGIWRR